MNEGTMLAEEEAGEALLPLFAYEEVAPTAKTREQIVAEKLAALRDFALELREPPESDATGSLAYLDMCDRLHKVDFMKFPTRCIAAQLAQDKETLDLSYAGLDKKGCVALAEALRINATITSLILIGNYVTASAGLAIVRALLETHSVHTIDLSVNRLGDVELVACGTPTVRGGAVVNELISPGSVTARLRLRDNRLTDADVALFADTLAENTALQLLDLSYNKVGYLGAVELAKVLARNGDLRELNLEWTCIGSAGSAHLLSEGFLQNNTIKTFNLSCCGLDDACAQLVGRVMGENAVEEIVIANNRIGPAGAEAIAKGLQMTSALSVLVLDGNPVLDRGCNALLAVAATGEVKTLRLLSMQHCGCTTIADEYAQAQDNTPGLTIRISESV